ncbi:MAG: LLM class flavin-dependent oxidoreductase, partial [Chloroflexi bacterium]
HFGDQVGPIAGLMAAADATTTLRVGSLVFDNDYRHPVVLAKEAASLDLLSDGRFDFGIGAGWMMSDYEQSGIPFDSPGTRIERMAEALTIFKRFFAGGEFSFEGKHYAIKGLEGAPTPVQKPHPPIVIGGGGRKMLELAAREADTVNVNFDLREGKPGRRLAQTGLASVTDEKLGWIREAAGERMEQALTIFKRFFAGGEFSFEGKHYTIKGLEGAPAPVQKPHPPIVIGGGGRKMLELAAREADTVNVNFDLREGKPGRRLAQTGLASVTDEKLGWIREAAGERMEQIELGVWTFMANVTDDRDGVAEMLAPAMGFGPADVLEVPHFMLGTADQIAEEIIARRERYGISHIVVPGDAADSLAPVVKRLAGT